MGTLLLSLAQGASPLPQLSPSLKKLHLMLRLQKRNSTILR